VAVATSVSRWPLRHSRDNGILRASLTLDDLSERLRNGLGTRVSHTRGMREDEGAFSILCEIEPATTPDLHRVRRQIVAFDGVTGLFLIPDNHIGRATVSSIAVAREVAALGGRAVACVNSRDRNLLGFQRDLLTAVAYGVREFLFVRGDDPTVGSRSDLTVRQMLSEARAYPDAEFSLGVTVRSGSVVPVWKYDADFWLVQACFDMDKLVAWRRSLDYKGQVFAGVLVMASAKMAARIASDLPEIDVPQDLIDALEHDADAGVLRALELVAAAQRSDAFDGVHLVPVGRYLQVAALMNSGRA
jgi:methylenetetrahydrofolate reductase (NADPH)